MLGVSVPVVADRVVLVMRRPFLHTLLLLKVGIVWVMLHVGCADGRSHCVRLVRVRVL